MSKLEDTLKIAHEELQKAQQKGKHCYDRNTKVRKFQPGDKVLVLLPTEQVADAVERSLRS